MFKCDKNRYMVCLLKNEKQRAKKKGMGKLCVRHSLIGPDQATGAYENASRDLT